MSDCACEAIDVVPWIFGALLLGVFLSLFLAQQPAPVIAGTSVPSMSVLRDDLGRIVALGPR